MYSQQIMKLIYLQNAVIYLAFCNRRLVQRLPKHRTELVDVIYLDVNHRPEWT